MRIKLKEIGKALYKGKKKKQWAINQLLKCCGNYDNIRKIDKMLYARVLKILRKNSQFKYDKRISFDEHINSYFGLDKEIYHILIKRGCKICGSHKHIHLHHIIPKSKGGSNEIINLKALCNKCHLKAHNRTHWGNENDC